jgi:hypothetical protein
MAKPEVRAAISDSVARGLSYEPAIVSSADWLVNGRSLREYGDSYDDLVEYIDIFYGLGREYVDAALEMAEARKLRELQIA